MKEIDELIHRLKILTKNLSHYYAAEGKDWLRESSNRQLCLKEFELVKTLVAQEIGKEKTLEIINSVPHLLWSEIKDLK